MADVHPIRKDLLSFLTILENLLRNLLISACEKCVDKQKINLQSGQSFLSAVLDTHRNILYNKPNIVYKSRADMNNRKPCNVGNERRLIDPITNKIRLEPDTDTFDVTLLVQLLKNIPENKCFLSRTPCAGMCRHCDVKKAAETVTYMRNVVMHEVKDNVYDDLLTKNIPLSKLDSYKTWGDLKQHVEETFDLLLAYTRDVGNFPMTGAVTTTQDAHIMELEMKMIKVFPEEKRKNHFDPIICRMLLNISTDKEENEVKTKELTHVMNEMKIVTNKLVSDISELIKAYDQRTDSVREGEIDPTPKHSEARINKMDSKKWLKKCQDLYNQIYKTGVNFFDYVSASSNIEQLFNNWFNEKVKISTPHDYALISKYSAEFHQLFENGQMSLSEESPLSSNNHILLISYIDSCIYYMKCSEATTYDCIREDLKSLDSEVEYCKRLHIDTFSAENIDIHRILILPNMTIKTMKAMSGIDDISFSIVTGDKWTSTDNIDSWLENLNASNFKVKLNNNIFTGMLSRILGFFSLLYKEVPHIYDDHYTLINKIPLTQDQKDVIESEELSHVILKGSYGTGKTLMLQKKIFKLVTESTGNITIYYIIADSAGMLYGHTKKLLENYAEILNQEGKKVDIKRCEDVFNPVEHKDGHASVTLCLMSFEEINHFTNFSNDLSIVLEAIIQEENTHVFIDEYNAENLTSNVARKLSDLVIGRMKESTLFIVPQPLQIYRSMNDTENLRPKGFCFQETKMDVVCLEEAIRNPKCIHELFQTAKDVICEFSTEYRFRRETFDDKIFKDDDQNEETELIKKLEEEKEEERTLDDISFGIQTESGDASYLNNSTPEELSIDTDLQNELPVESSFQKTHHLCSDENSDKVKNSYKIQNTSICGHAIKGHLPTCYIPFKLDNNSADDISNQALCHLKLALLDSKANRTGSVIICSTINESELVTKALGGSSETKIYLPSLKQYKQSDALTLQKDFEDGIIITDFLGIRGMELRNVVVILSTNDYFLAPFFLEVFTRAVNQLSLILLNFGYSGPEKSIAIKLWDRWNEKKLIQNVVISCKKKHISYYSDDLDVNTSERVCKYGIKDHIACFVTREEQNDVTAVFSRSAPIKLLLRSLPTEIFSSQNSIFFNLEDIESSGNEVTSFIEENPQVHSENSSHEENPTSVAIAQDTSHSSVAITQDESSSKSVDKRVEQELKRLGRKIRKGFR